ncbi:hypothetical protein JOF41_000043 [Saccharothrix coeruleofusca]|nr:hypothetical protein [Saccharothrix coeruleofusca]
MARLLKVGMERLEELLKPVDVRSIDDSANTWNQCGGAGAPRCAAVIGCCAVSERGERGFFSDSKDVSAVDRRSLLGCGIAVAALVKLGSEELRRVASAVEQPRRYLDGEVIDHFRDRLATCKANDGAQGAATVLPAVLGILGVVDEHARAATPAVRRSLLAVGADAAEFAAWLYRDSREPVTASFWHDRAIEWAQEAGDLPMQGYVLLRKSQMAYEERDGLRVLTLARAAQHGPWQLPPKVRAEVTQQEALGMAMLGEPLALVQRKLDDARRLADADDAGDERYAHLGVRYDEGVHRLRAATCHLEAGRPGRAATLFGEVLSGGGLSRRDEGYFRARRASALALSGEPDDAAEEGVVAARLATTVGSGRTKRELARVLETLAPWHNRPGPRALREAVTS